MLVYDDALQRLLAVAPRLPAERCDLDAAHGRVLAESIRSLCDLPPFDHAAMDGYALHAGDGLAAGSVHAVTGSVAAGATAPPIDASSACEIMTGARLPPGADAVVALEAATRLATTADGRPTQIALMQNLDAGRNVRRGGTDVRSGDAVAAIGTVMTPARIMLFAALGVARFVVVRRPRIALIATGSELQPRLDAPLGADRIYASNAPYLCAALNALGARIVHTETVADSQHEYLAAVQRSCANGADLVVSTGAVSAGRYDFVPDALHAAGATILFRKVAMRPGKPLLVARLDAAQGPLVLALPGTPMAVAVGLRFFLAPLLRRMTGQPDEVYPRAVLGAPCERVPGTRHFLHAQLHRDRDGRLHARPNQAQQPFRMAPFAQSEGWVILPEGEGALDAGSLVDIAMFDPAML